MSKWQRIPASFICDACAWSAIDHRIDQDARVSLEVIALNTSRLDYWQLAPRSSAAYDTRNHFSCGTRTQPCVWHSIFGSQGHVSDETTNRIGCKLTRVDNRVVYKPCTVILFINNGLSPRSSSDITRPISARQRRSSTVAGSQRVLYHVCARSSVGVRSRAWALTALETCSLLICCRLIICLSFSNVFQEHILSALRLTNRNVDLRTLIY